MLGTLRDIDSSLIEASIAGDLVEVKRLVSCGADPKAEGKGGFNAIQKACSHNQKEVVKFFLSNPKWNLVNHQSNLGWTPAHSASSFGRVEIVRLLICNGAKNHDRSGITPKKNAEMNLQALSKLKTGEVFKHGESTNAEDYKAIIIMWNDPKAVTDAEKKRIAEEKLALARTVPLAPIPTRSWPIAAPTMAGADAGTPAHAGAGAPAPSKVGLAKIMESQRTEPKSVMPKPDILATLEDSVRSKTTHFVPTASGAFSSTVAGKPDEELRALPELPKTLGLFELVQGESKRFTDLMRKFSLNQLELIRVLLLQNPKSLEQTDKEGRTALHYAAEWGDANIVDVLLRAKCQVNGQDNKGNTPLHLAAAFGNSAVINLLMNHGANPKIENSNGCTALQEAAAKNDTGEGIVALLASDLVQINYAARGGFTALHSAARFGKLNAVNILLDAGADPNRLSITDDSAQMVAYQRLSELRKERKHSSMHEAVIRRLVEAENDTLPMKLARYRKWYKEHSLNDLEMAFIDAAETGNIQELEAIYTIYPAVLSAKPSGYSALHGAAYYGQTEILERLKLLYSAAKIIFPINDIDLYVQTPLHLAVVSGHAETVEWLLKNKAAPAQANKQNFSAVHEAAAKGFPEIVDIFLKHDVKVNLTTSVGWSILHSAARYGHIKVVQTLLGYGANSQHTDSYGETILDSALKGSVKDISQRADHKQVIALLLSHEVKYHQQAMNHLIREDIRKLLDEHPDLAIVATPATLPLTTDATPVRSLSDEKPIISLPLRQALLQIDLVNAGSDEVRLRAVAQKTAGSNPGALYNNETDSSRWLGKMGYDVLSKHDRRAHGMATRTRTDLGVKLDAAKEKMGMDFYRIFAEDRYHIPETHLARLFVREAQIMSNKDYASKIEATFPIKQKIDQTIFVMSRWETEFTPLHNISEAFNLKIKAGFFPEHLIIAGKHASTEPLIRMLAHARILGDVDVFGVGFSNVGYRLEKGQPIWIKVDGTHTFQGYSADDYLNSGIYRDEKNGNPKNIQINSFSSGEVHVIEWNNLSKKQQEIYIEELAKGIALCQDDEFLGFMLLREGGFHQYDLSDDQIRMSYARWTTSWLERQAKIYADELKAYATKNSGIINAWLLENKQALGLIVPEVKPAPSVLAIPPTKELKYEGMTEAKIHNAEMPGKTTRLIDLILSDFKASWARQESWFTAEKLFEMVLNRANGDKKLALRALGAICYENGSVSLRELLIRKGASTEEVDKLYKAGKDKMDSLQKILINFGWMLSEAYEEKPFYELIVRLQNFIRHELTVDKVTAEYHAKLAKSGKLAMHSPTPSATPSHESAAVSEKSITAASGPSHATVVEPLEEIRSLLKNAELRAEKAERRAEEAEMEVKNLHKMLAMQMEIQTQMQGQITLLLKGQAFGSSTTPFSDSSKSMRSAGDSATLSLK